LAEQPGRVRLIAGLGNPGPEYAQTRHNIGFAVLDALAVDWGMTWEKAPKCKAQVAKSPRGLLLKPLSYMNRSGESVRAAADFYQIGAAESLIVLDDTALPLGRLRLRSQGSSGGHNGLESVLMHFGSDAVPRLRIGIGSPPAEGSTDYVLGRFFEEERPQVQQAVSRAVEAINCIIDKGLLSAMNLFNKAPDP
jgi:PTH1 family peptidyl-tRNA hydrolase